MAAFLTALLLFAFSLGSPDQPQLDPVEMVANIAEKISHVAPPQSDPVGQHASGKPSPLPTPPSSPGPSSSPAATPDTAKVEVLNTASGKTIPAVAGVAEANSPVLVVASPAPSPSLAPIVLPSAVPSPSIIPLFTPPPADCPPPPVRPVILGKTSPHVILCP